MRSQRPSLGVSHSSSMLSTKRGRTRERERERAEFQRANAKAERVYEEQSGKGEKSWASEPSRSQVAFFFFQKRIWGASLDSNNSPPPHHRATAALIRSCILRQAAHSHFGKVCIDRISSRHALSTRARPQIVHRRESELHLHKRWPTAPASPLSLSLSLSQLFPTTAPALFSLPSPPSTCRTPSTTLSATERAPNLCTHINQPLATAFIAARAFALLFSRKFPASTVASREESKSEAASISTSCTTLLLAASAPCLLSSHTPSAGRLWTLPCASEAHSGGANASGWKRGLPP